MNFQNYQKTILAEILRVDHAGEYGAVRIYSGQLKALAHKANFSQNAYDIDQDLNEIEHMRSQECQHLQFFNNQLIEQGVLNTTFLPIWHHIGYFAGYLSAWMGKDFAMTMTKAVEEVIDQHYQQQIEQLQLFHKHTQQSQEQNCNQSKSNENINYYENLANKLEQFRLEELEHRDYAVNHNDEFFDEKNLIQHQNRFCKKSREFGNKIFEKFIKIGCKGAIWLSKKI